jgi:hypothetical protein
VRATIAHNLIRWPGTLRLEIRRPFVAKKIRRRFLSFRVASRPARDGASSTC